MMDPKWLTSISESGLCLRSRRCNRMVCGLVVTFALIFFFLSLFASSFRIEGRLVAENATLRHH